MRGGCFDERRETLAGNCDTTGHVAARGCRSDDSRTQ